MIDTMHPQSARHLQARPHLSPWVRSLFAPRRRAEGSATILCNPLRAMDVVVFLLYAAILAYAIPHHLGSDDEAQAWLLARDNSLWTLLGYRYHYEGAPGLWPILLWSAARLHLPYASIHWIAAAFALSGVALLLRFAPFPPIFRWLLPFTFFLQYQYAVIARPYVLVAPLIFLLCILFNLEHTRPILFALVAGLMANLSFHAAMLAGFFSLLYLHRLYGKQARPESRPMRRQITAALSLFTLLALFSAAVAFPAPDVATDAYAGDTSGTTHPFLRKLIPTQSLPAAAPPLDPFLKPNFNLPGPEPAAPAPPNPVLMVIVRTIVLGANAAFYPVAKSNLLALLFLTLFFLWLRSRGSLHLALPWLLSIMLSVQILVLDHHTGQFLLALLAAAWISLDAPVRSAKQKPSRLASSLSAVALVVTFLQIGWSAHCILAERTVPYDPGLATEQFLTQNFAGKRVAGFSYETVSTQVWAPHSLFFNQTKSFWVWSAPLFINRRRTEVLNQHPDAIVMTDYISGPEFLYDQVTNFVVPGRHAFWKTRQFWESHGYHVTHTFCGDRLMRGGTSNSICELILEPNP
jgi:hypothetical protein